MCDCFHVVLPTWPGAPGSGAPHSRLQPASLGRVGSAGAPGLNGGRAVRDSLHARKEGQERWMGASGRVSCAFGPSLALWVSAFRSYLCLPCASHSFPHLCCSLWFSGFHYSVWFLALRTRSHFFIRGPPWDTALSSKAAIEACVLHTGWNRSRVNSCQLQARRPYARSGL